MKTCPWCRQTFGTTQEYRHHANQKHGQKFPIKAVSHSGPSRRGRGTNRNAGVRQSNGGGGNAAASSGQRYTASPSVIQSGVDRILSKTFPANSLAVNSVIYETIITVSSSNRLRTLARAFQRISFKKISFSINPKGSAFTSGGYLASFISDPDDDAFTLQSLTSHQGSQSGRYSERRTVTAVIDPNYKFYTSHTSGENRFVSPGRLVIISDGDPSAAVPLTVDMMWTVELSVPSLEIPRSVRSIFVSKTDWYPYEDRHHLRTGYKINNAYSYNPDLLIDPSPDVGTIFKLPVPLSIEYNEGVGDTGTFRYWFVKIVASEGGNNVSWIENPKSSETNSKIWQSSVPGNLLLPSGATLEVFQLPQLSKKEVLLDPLLTSGPNIKGEVTLPTPCCLTSSDSFRKSFLKLISTLNGLTVRLENLEKDSRKLPQTGEQSQSVQFLQSQGCTSQLQSPEPPLESPFVEIDGHHSDEDFDFDPLYSLKDLGM